MIASAMGAEWQHAEAQGLRAEALRMIGRNRGMADVLSLAGLRTLDAYTLQADRLERAYLEPGEVLEDGRGPLTADERAAMDAVRVGGLPA